MSEPVSESMKHHNTDINELKNLPKVTMRSFIHYWDVFLCGVSPAKEKIGIDYNAVCIDDHGLYFYYNCYIFVVQEVFMAKGLIDVSYL